MLRQIRFPHNVVTLSLNLLPTQIAPLVNKTELLPNDRPLRVDVDKKSPNEPIHLNLRVTPLPESILVHRRKIVERDTEGRLHIW